MFSFRYAPDFPGYFEVLYHPKTVLKVIIDDCSPFPEDLIKTQSRKSFDEINDETHLELADQKAI